MLYDGRTEVASFVLQCELNEFSAYCVFVGRAVLKVDQVPRALSVVETM